jgi:phage N-6-adenine-methyltransferase
MADNWYTPKWIFDALNVEFDIDVCSPIGGTGLVPAKKFYSIEDDALKQDWHGLVWMNPPYSKPAPFLDKFIEHNNGLALITLAKARWFHKVWNSSASILPMPVNLKFVRPEGGENQVMMNTALIGLGEIAVDAMKQSNLGKLR